MGLPLVLLNLKVINTADQLICDLAELLCTDIHLLESIHYLFRLITLPCTISESSLTACSTSFLEFSRCPVLSLI